MRRVTMDKETFRQIIEHNMADHKTLFEEASKAFYEKFNVKLEEVAQGVRAKKMNYREASKALGNLGQTCPQGHCDEYQAVIDMLDHEIGDTVVLDESEFQQFVKNEWHWMSGFTASYTSNTGKFLG